MSPRATILRTERRRRRPAVVVPQADAHASASSPGFASSLVCGERHRQRLLAEHVLLRTQRLHRDAVVAVVRRRDVDDMHFGVREHGVEIRRRALEPELLRRGRRAPQIPADNDRRNDRQRQLEEAVDLPVCVGVRAPHERMPDHCHVQHRQLLLPAAIRLRRECHRADDRHSPRHSLPRFSRGARIYRVPPNNTRRFRPLACPHPRNRSGTPSRFQSPRSLDSGAS